MDLSPRPIGRPRSCHCGICAKCKHADYMRAWYQGKTPDERRAWIALRDPQRVAAHERARSRTSQKLESIKRSEARNPARARAHWMTWNALRDGRLFKSPCHCGAVKVEGHHPDYAQPLVVEWLCRRHHVERHPRALSGAA